MLTRIMFLKRNFGLILILAMGLTACGAPSPIPQPQKSPIQVSPLSSPLRIAAASSSSGVVAFQFDRPIHAGITEVHGTGPAGVPVYIADVTFMGEPLGTGTIGADGKFTIHVSPLLATHRIGLALGILDGTQWKPADFYDAKFYGPNAMQVPQVGFFHDTEMVPSP